MNFWITYFIKIVWRNEGLQNPLGLDDFFLTKDFPFCYLGFFDQSKNAIFLLI